MFSLAVQGMVRVWGNVRIEGINLFGQPLTDRFEKRLDRIDDLLPRTHGFGVKRVGNRSGQHFGTSGKHVRGIYGRCPLKSNPFGQVGQDPWSISGHPPRPKAGASSTHFHALRDIRLRLSRLCRAWEFGAWDL